MNAAIYCRVSTEDQEKEGSSLQSQLKACLKYCEDHNCTVTHSFQEVYSGLSLERPKLDEARRLIRAGLINVLVIYCLDRLSRNATHGVIIRDELDKYKVSLVSVTEDIDNSPLGQAITYLRGTFSQIEAEKIKERTHRGKREKALEGKYSTAPARLFGYNYDVLSKRRTIDEAEAEVVRRIFNWFADEGYTLYRAAKQLNDEGVTAPRGGRWNTTSIYNLVTHAAYCGVTYAFRFRVSKGRSPIKTPPSDWIEIPGASPPIVSKAVYDTSQEQLKKNRHRSPNNKKHDYLFAGARLRCGTCGRSMSGSVRSRNGKPYLFYRCICKAVTSYYDKCTQPSVSAGKVERIVWENLMKILDHPEMLLEEIKKRAHPDPVTDEADEFLLQNSIRKAKEEELRYVQLYGKGKITEVVFETMAEKTQERMKSCEKQLRDLREKRESLERAEVNADKLIESAKHFSKVLHDADYALKVKAIEALDIKVTYTPEKDLIIEGLLPVGVTDSIIC